MNGRTTIVWLVLGVSTVIGAPFDEACVVLGRRCSACHTWARDGEAVAILRPQMARRWQSGDHHIDRLCSPADRNVLQRYLFPASVQPTGTTTTVVPPDEHGLAAVAAVCGRCHPWAADRSVVRTRRERILQRLKAGHGSTGATSEQRSALVAFTARRAE